MDETLDVLAAHGIAGLTGILFIGFFAQLSWNGVSDGLFYGDAGQLGWQAIAARRHSGVCLRGRRSCCCG